MAWIKMIPEAEAEGELKEMYDQNVEPWGGVDNILKIHSLSPESLKAHISLYKTVMYGKSPIRRPEREMIAVAVSAVNGCHYLLTHHGEGLLRLTKDEAFVDQLKLDYKKADLTTAQRAMLDYSVKLTESPGKMSEDDLAPLREAGFDDRAILDINQIVGYFAFANRLADGLGVELEDFWKA